MYKNRFLTILVIILIMAFALSASSGALSFDRKGLQPGIGTQITPKLHTYGIFWEVGDGYSSTLILRNKDSQRPVTANVDVYSHDGRKLRGITLPVAPNSVGRVALSDIVKTKGDKLRWGSIILEFDRPNPSIMGQVVIENYKQGINFDLPIQSGFSNDTNNLLYAPWWLPDKGTDATVTLFNSSSQPIVVAPSITVKEVEWKAHRIALGPHETKQIQLRELLDEISSKDSSIGSVTLHYIGPLHALHPAMLISNPDTGFSLFPEFNARHSQVADTQTTWRFPDVFVSPDNKLGFDKSDKLTAYALVSNGTNASLTPQVDAFIGGSSSVQKVTLPITALKPSETRLINLSDFVRSGLITKNATYFAMDATHNGSPGDLGITVFSVGKNKDFVFRSEGGIKASKRVYSSYWDIDDDLVALLTVQNAGDEGVEVKAVLNYQTPVGVSTYVLPHIKVAGNGSQMLNLKEIILAGIHDENGNVIPAGTTFGTLTINVVGGSSSAAIYGGSTTFDPDKGGYGLLMDPCDYCQMEDQDFCNPDGSSGDPFNNNPSDPGCSPTCITCGGGGGAPGDGGTSLGPEVIAITPSNGDLNSSVSVLLDGEQFGFAPDVMVDGTGISVDVTDSNDTQIQCTFNIDANANTGNHNVWIESDTGVSNAVSFNIYTPPPQIYSIDPSDWSQGDSVDVTITGIGFGSNPNLQVSGYGITPNVYFSSDTEIDATFAIASDAVPGEHNVTVTVGNNIGTGILHNPGTSNTATTQFQVDLGGMTGVSILPAILNLSTGDSAVPNMLTVVFRPTDLNVLMDFPISNLALNYGGSTAATLTVPSQIVMSGQGPSVKATPSYVAGSAGASGVFMVGIEAGGKTFNTQSRVVVPPQILLQMMRNEARGLSVTSTGRIFIGWAMRNRLNDPMFGNPSTYFDAITVRAGASHDPSVTTGVQPELNDAASVFDGGSGFDPTGGCQGWWSPNDSMMAVVNSAINSRTTTLPDGTGVVFNYNGHPEITQVVYFPSVGLNTGIPSKANDPAFIFVRKRKPTDPAVVRED